MGLFAWIAQHSDLLQNLGIISGFLFTAHSIRSESKDRKIGNIMAMVQNHHSIWKQLYENPELSRVIDANADLSSEPITTQERIFITSVILHMDAIHRAIRARMFVRIEGMRKDINGLFSLPIPKQVWGMVKPLQDRDFVAFVESCLNESPLGEESGRG